VKKGDASSNQTLNLTLGRMVLVVLWLAHHMMGL